MRQRLILVLAFLTGAGLITGILWAYVTNQSAWSVLGQTDFVSNPVNGSTGVPALNTVADPQGVGGAISQFFVADTGNNRLLIFDSIPTSSSTSATTIWGQTSAGVTQANQGGSASNLTLDGPQGVFTDGTKLYVADTVNNRVLVFNTIPVSPSTAPSFVLGQPSYTTTSSGSASTQLNSPSGLFVSPSYLYVADTNNNRVLLYSLPISANAQAAASVIGQTTTSLAVAGTGQASVSQPRSVWVDFSNIYVADTGNNRALIYPVNFGNNGPNASVVVGQNGYGAGFTTANENNVNPVAYGLKNPKGICVDTNNNLFISDTGNNRVLVFNPIPAVNNASAVSVIGQNILSGSIAGLANQGGSPAAYTLSSPVGLWMSGSEPKLWVADVINNRVLSYGSAGNTPTPSPTFTPTLNPTNTPTGTLTPFPNSVSCSQPLIYDSGGTDLATAIAVDPSGNVYVGGDSPNGAVSQFRVIKYDPNGNTVWNSTYFSGTNDLLLGLAVDQGGNVYAVGSQQNSSRVYLIVKFNSVGITQWVQNLDGTNGAHDNGAQAVMVDPTNTYIYVTGPSWTSSNWDFMTAKYDMSGNLQAGWPVKFDSGGNHDIAWAIAGDPAGNIYVGGESDIAGVNHDRLIKYNSSGVVQWNIQFVDSVEQILSLAVDPTGSNIYAGSYRWNGTVDVPRLLKFNTNSGATMPGGALYGTAIGGHESGVTVDAQGNIYCALQDTTNNKYHTLKYDPSGNLLWDVQFARGLGVDQSNAVAVYGSDVFVTGQSFNGGNYDFMTLKYHLASSCPFTYTPTFTNTIGGSFTVTNSPTKTPTNSFTNTPTGSWTYTLTRTNTPTNTFTFTPTITSTFTITPTFTSTFTVTPTATWTPVNFAGYFGNQNITASGSGTLDLNTAISQFSIRFTQATGKNISGIRFYGTNNGAGDQYQVSIQGDASGNPNGTFFGTPVNLVLSTGWNNVVYSSGPLPAPATYHIVVAALSGVGGPNYFSIGSGSNPLQNIIPNDQSIDNSLMNQLYTGSWANRTSMPMFALDYTDTSKYGAPYYNGIVNACYGPNVTGEVFRVTTGDKQVNRLGFYFLRQGLPPDNLYYVLEDLTQGVTLDQGTLTVPASVPTVANWVEGNLSQQRVLLNGHQFRVWLNSPGSDFSNYYSITGNSILAPTAYLEDLSYDGVNSYTVNSS